MFGNKEKAAIPERIAAALARTFGLI